MKAQPNRYMFDTSALNQLCDNNDHYRLVMETVNRGASYYFTEEQCDEAKQTIYPNTASENYTEVDISRARRAVRLLEIIARMQPTFVRQFATFYPGGFPLDGSRILWPDDRQDLEALFRDICNDNPAHHGDAIIAVMAMYNDLTLVTHDNRMYKKTVAHFPAKVMRYGDFIAGFDDSTTKQ